MSNRGQLFRWKFYFILMLKRSIYERIIPHNITFLFFFFFLFFYFNILHIGAMYETKYGDIWIFGKLGTYIRIFLKAQKKMNLIKEYLKISWCPFFIPFFHRLKGFYGNTFCIFTKKRNFKCLKLIKKKLECI